MEEKTTRGTRKTTGNNNYIEVLMSNVCRTNMINAIIHVVVNPLLPAYWGESGGGGGPFLLLYGGSPPASPASRLAGLLRRRDPSTNPGLTAWCVCICGQQGWGQVQLTKY